MSAKASIAVTSNPKREADSAAARVDTPAISTRSRRTILRLDSEVLTIDGLSSLKASPAVKVRNNLESLMGTLPGR